MTELISSDLRYVAQRLPRDVRDLLREFPGRVFVGGGFIRATIAGETPSDIDIFVDSPEVAEAVAAIIIASRIGSKRHDSGNAITILTSDRLPVQIITRWTFQAASDLVRSFDFTVCQAAVWRSGNQSNSPWSSAVGGRFYIDLAARRLVYTNPVREEEAGGSMLRVIKYVKRGYSIQVSSLGAVIARLVAAMRPSDTEPAVVLAGLLREVDPLLVVDGLEVVDDHESEAA